ncbi:MAG: hypothetical protein IPL26_19125 [Leptospiraceae bacterium]|nr:hypothetical protein [Leptospiraceae bacterium]
MEILNFSNERLAVILDSEKKSELTLGEIDKIKSYLANLEKQDKREVNLAYLSFIYSLSKALYDNFKYDEAGIGIYGIINFIGNEVSEENKDILSKCYHLNGMILLQKKEFYYSILALRKSLYLIENDSDIKERVYDSLAQTLKEVYFFEEAIHFFLQSIEIKTRKQDLFGLSISYGGLGDLYSKLEDFAKAEEYIQKDIDISKEINNSQGLLIAHFLLVTMYNNQLEFLIYKKNLKNQINEIFRIMKQQEQVILLLTKEIESLSFNLYDIPILTELEIAKFTILKNNLQEASVYLLSAKEKSKNANIKCLGIYYQVYALYFESIGDIDNAIEQLVLSEEVFRNNNLSLELIGVLNKTSEILLRNSQTPKAIEALKTIIELCENLNLEHLVEYYENKIKTINETDWVMIRLQRFIGREVTKNLLTIEKEPEISKVKVAIFFSDIRSFTSISEKVEPEVLLDMLNTYMSIMTRIVIKNKGVVNKYIGDAIMAYFGHHNSDSNFLKSALDSCLTMLEELQLLNYRFTSLGRPKFHIGIGLHFGEVIAGRMGSISRREFTIIGDNVNLGSRLEGICKKYGVSLILSDDFVSGVKSLLDANYSLIELDLITVKGKEKPVSIFTAYKKENTDNQILLAWEVFKEARQFYLNRNWAESINLLNTITNAELEVTKQFYLKRNTYYLQNPNADFSGVYNFDEK